MDDHKIMYDLLKETREDVKELKSAFNAHVLAVNASISRVSEPQTAFRVLAATAAKLSGIVALCVSVAALVGAHKK